MEINYYDYYSRRPPSIMHHEKKCRQKRGWWIIYSEIPITQKRDQRNSKSELLHNTTRVSLLFGEGSLFLRLSTKQKWRKQQLREWLTIRKGIMPFSWHNVNAVKRGKIEGKIPFKALDEVVCLTFKRLCKYFFDDKRRGWNAKWHDKWRVMNRWKEVNFRELQTGF